MWSAPRCEGNSWRPSSGGGGAPRCAGPPQAPAAGARSGAAALHLLPAPHRGPPPPSAGPAPAAAAVQQRRTAPARRRENAEVRGSPIARTARLPRTLSALSLASTRGCRAPGRAARCPPPPPPPRGPPAGRAAWEGGRAWKQRESVRSSGWRGMEEKPATMRASALSLPPSLPPPAPSLLRPSEIISRNTGII